jgi:hypothetical protein
MHEAQEGEMSMGYFRAVSDSGEEIPVEIVETGEERARKEIGKRMTESFDRIVRDMFFPMCIEGETVEPPKPMILAEAEAGRQIEICDILRLANLGYISRESSEKILMGGTG